MKTQSFKSKLFILAFLSLLLLGSTACEKKNNKFVGLQLWSVRNDIKTNPDSVIRAIGDMGYGFVEAAGYADGKFYGYSPDSFANLVKQSGMKFLSSHAGYNAPDSVNMEETMAWWDQCIAAHKKAGVEYIVQPSMEHAVYDSLELLQRYCDYFNTIGEKCNAAGIRFGYHNHSGEFKKLQGNVIYDYMLNNTDPEKVFFEMDLYWAVEGGVNPIDYFNKYPGRFELWHVKDKEEVGASGTMDFQGIFAEKEKSGMKYYIVEVEEYNFSPLESIRKSREFLENAEYVK